MKIVLSRLSTKELATLTELVLSISKSGKYKMIEKNDLLKKVEETFAQYSEVYSKLTYSGKGKTVAAADKKRDKLYAGMRDFLKGYIRLEVLEHTSSAKMIYEVFKKFGLNISQLNYVEATAQYRKFLEELSEPIYTEHLENLALTSVLELIKQAQVEFDAIYSEQIAINSELRNIPSASSSRGDLEKMLRAYFTYISAMVSNADFLALKNEISELVKSVKPNGTEKKDDKKEA